MLIHLLSSEAFSGSLRMSDNSTPSSQKRSSYSVVSDLMKMQPASAWIKRHFLFSLPFKVPVGLDPPFKTRDKLQKAISCRGRIESQGM